MLTPPSLSPEEKHDGSTMGYLQMFTLWFSINVVVNNLAVAFLGPLVFNLGWVDCVCLILFANALSACGAAYTGTFGAESGNRTMVCCRHMHIAGYFQRALIYDLVTHFANRYVPCMVDTWSILYGILAVQTCLPAQCDTSSGL